MKNLVYVFSICVLSGFTSFLSAQNLVFNGSFETLDPSPNPPGCPSGNCCPNGDSFYIGKPQFWSGFRDKNGLDLSPDYFKSCSPYDGTGYAEGFHNYPGLNFSGCAFPRDGQAYVGFTAGAPGVHSSGWPGASEYLYTTVTLSQGMNYYVEFYVYNSNGHSSDPADLFTASTENIGMHFTQNPNVDWTGPNEVYGLNHKTPQIPNTFPASDYYRNTTDWQKISGYFTPPSGGLWYIAIGNFDPANNNNPPNPVLETKPNYVQGQSTLWAYYFLDAVTIIPFNQAHPNYSPYVSGGSVCDAGTTLTLQNVPLGATASWSVSPTNLFTGPTSGSGTTASLTAQPGVSGPATITFTLSTDCGSQVVPLHIDVGIPFFTTVANNGEPVDFGGTYANPYYVNSWNTVVVANSYDPFFHVNFTLGSSKFTNGSAQGNNYNFLTKYNDNNITLEFWASNNCGTNFGYIYFCNTNCSGGVIVAAKIAPKPKVSLSSSPNPASSAISIQVTDSLSSNSLNGTLDQPYELHMMDRFSRKVFSTQSNEKSLEIPIHNLPPDIYYLNMIYKDAVVQKQIIIKR